MPDNKRALDIVIAARDETFQGFKSANEHARGFLQNIKEINAESRSSGEGGLEKLIRGGGALGLTTFAVETGGKIAEEAQEQLRQFGTHQVEASEGIAKTAEAGIRAVPVLGSLYEGFSKMNEAAQDFEGHVLKSFGASDEFVQHSVRTGEAIAKEWENVLAIQTAMMQSTRQDIDARELLKSTGDERALTAEKRRYREEIHEMDAAHEEGLKKIGDSEEQRAALEESFFQQRTAADRRHAAEVAQIERESNRAIERMHEDHEAALLQIEHAGAERRLRAAGLDLQSQLTGIGDSFAKAERDARRQAEDARKAHPQEAGSIEYELGTTLSRLGEQRRQAEDDARTAHDRKVVQDNAMLLHTLEDAQADSHAAMLRASGRYYDADAAQRQKAARDRAEQLDGERRTLLDQRTDLDAQLAEMRSRLTDASLAAAATGGAVPAAQSKAVADAQAQRDQLQKQIDENAKLRALAGQQAQAEDRTAGIRQTNEQKDRDLDVLTRQMQQHVALLREQADQGNRLAGMEADRAEKVDRLRQAQQ